MKTALVLGGGGARGLAHIGVLKTLQQYNFKPDIIVGCSIGAIIGGMYACQPDAHVLQNRITDMLKSEMYAELNIEMLERHRNGTEKKDYIQQVARNAVKRVMLNVVATKKSIVKAEKIDRIIDVLIPSENIENLQIPFACNATDLLNGRAVLFHHGDLRSAVKASSAIPGYLPPRENNSQILVDGAVSYALPVKFAKMLGADYIIAVEVPQEMTPQKDFTNVFDIILRANTITQSILAAELREDADVLISPHVGDYNWFDFAKVNDIIRSGEEAAEMQMPKLLQATSKRNKSMWRFWKN